MIEIERMTERDAYGEVPSEKETNRKRETHRKGDTHLSRATQ